MTLDDQLRDSLERTAELMPAPSGLGARALRAGQRLQHRRRSAVATAGAGVLTAAALGGYAALPNGGGRPSAVAAQSSIPADQLSDVLTRMAAQPDPGATAPFWYIRTSQHYLFDGTEHDGSRQEWYGRTGDGRRVSSDGSVLPMGKAGFAPLGPGAPIDWDQLDALPTSPDALAAVIAQGAAAIAATPVRDQPSPTVQEATVGELSNLLYAPPSSPALRAAAITLLAQAPGVEVSLDGTDATGRSGLSITYQLPGELENIIVDRTTGQLLESSATPPNGTVNRTTTLVSAPVDSDTTVPTAG